MNDCPYVPFVTFPRAAPASSGTKHLREKVLLVVLANLLCGSLAFGSDLTLAVGGKVSIELLSSDAEFHNTLTIASPAVSVALTGCKLETAPGMGTDVRILSEKTSQHGCRVTLDADPAVAGVQPFLAGTKFQFRLCAQTDADPDCEHIWSSDPSANSDAFEHLTTTPLHSADFPDRIFELAWEDLPDGGDFDFNDLIAVVRIEQDSDGDGLWDDWEKFGIDTTGDGTIDLDLPGLGANPLHKDIFVEIDWLDCTLTGSDCPAVDTHSHKPKPGVVEAVVQAFANANVTNPDSIPGITLHIDVDDAIAHEELVGLPNCYAGIGFDALKADPANFGSDNPRRFAYHYALFVHNQSSSSGSSSGCGERPGNDFEVALGEWTDKVGTFMQQAGTLMHELGHNLGLKHGGGNHVNYKPNYLSVMNYIYQTSGIPPTDPDGPGPLLARLDYSRSALANLDEADLDEPAGVGGDAADTVFFTCPDSTTGTGVASAAIDWDCDGAAADLGVSNDINGDSVANVAPNPLTGFWDWGNLKYDFQNSGDYEDGSHTPIEEQELDFPTFVERVAPELSISQSAALIPTPTESHVIYTLTVTNNRPATAVNVRVTDRLPRGTTFTYCSATQGGVCDGVANRRTITFASLAGGASATVTLIGRVNCMVPDGAALANTARVDFSTSDADPANNTATSTVSISNPPPVLTGVTVSRSTLGPPRHQFVDVAVGYSARDNCCMPICTLAVTSNEPVLVLDGRDRTPDWQIVDDHHVRLRAERSPQGDGRTYTITVTCKDASGASTSEEVAVTVPK